MEKIIKEREERKKKEGESKGEIYLQEIVFRDTSYCYGKTIRISLSRKEISRTCQLWDRRYQIVKRKVL